MSRRCYRYPHTKSMRGDGQLGSCLYGLRENSVNEKRVVCRVIMGHKHVDVDVYVCVIEDESGRESAQGLLYNAVEPVFVVLRRSRCDMSGLTDVLIGKKKKKSLLEFSKSGIS